jgi:hypothetical protein
MNPKLAALIAARDKLNADIATLQGASSISDATLDGITTKVLDVDNDVVTALIPANPPPTSLDFTVFDAAVTAFKADGKLSQQDVDNVAQMLKVNTP